MTNKKKKNTLQSSILSCIFRSRSIKIQMPLSDLYKWIIKHNKKNICSDTHARLQHLNVTECRYMYILIFLLHDRKAYYYMSICKMSLLNTIICKSSRFCFFFTVRWVYDSGWRLMSGYNCRLSFYFTVNTWFLLMYIPYI